MKIGDGVAVVLPVLMIACGVLLFRLTLRLVKVLRSVYLHNDSRLEPLSIYKCVSSASFHSCAKSLLPVYGLLSYSSPQFDLPTSLQLFLVFVHWSLLWSGNVALGSEGFDGGMGCVVAVGATSIALGMTYLLHLYFVRSFNYSDPSDLSSLTRTELNRRDNSSIIDNSHIPASRPLDSLQRPSKGSLEGLFLVYMTVAVGVDFWSIGSGVESVGVVYQWLLGVAVDVVVRAGVCGVLTGLKAVPNYGKDYYVVDYGLTLNQLLSLKPGNSDKSERPALESSVLSPAPPATPRKFPPVSPFKPSPVPHHSSPKPCFSPSALRRSSPLPLPKFSPSKALHLPALPAPSVPKNFARDFDDYIDGLEQEKTTFQREASPLRLDSESSSARKEEENRPGSSHISEETMPEVPHNMQSPIESPKGFSGMRFYRTPERPYNNSPEKSPEKPFICLKSPTKFALRLQEIDKSMSESEPESQQAIYSVQTHTDLPRSTPPIVPSWQPVVADDEDYMVEFVPGGIMPNHQLISQNATSGRSLSTNKPSTAGPEGRRSKSQDRKQSPAVSKLRTAMPAAGKPSSRVYTEEDAPVSEEVLRDIGNAEGFIRKKRTSRKEVEDTVEELIQAAQADAPTQEYDRLVDILAARNRFHHKHSPVSNRSPYNVSMAGLADPRGSRSSRLRLVEDPEAAERSAKQLEALSNIYAGSRSGSRRRDRSKGDRSSSRGREQEQ